MLLYEFTYTIPDDWSTPLSDLTGFLAQEAELQGWAEGYQCERVGPVASTQGPGYRSFLYRVTGEYRLVLKDYNLWDGKTELFVSWLPVPIQSTGPVTLSPHMSLEYERRLLKGHTRTGIPCVFYRDAQGFKHIMLEEKQNG